MAEDYAPKEIIGVALPCTRCGNAVLCRLGTDPKTVICSDHECQHEFGALGAISGDRCIHCGVKMTDLCPYNGVNECWDAQEARADPDFTCPIHGQAHDTLERLGVDVL